jgi:thymidylate synthase
MLKRSLAKLKERNNLIHDENQYLTLIEDILNEGIMENTRNGNAKTIFGSAMHFCLLNNKIPLLTTKKLAWKTCLRELLWFISGKTDNNILKNQNVQIWNDNASREFLNSRGLHHLEEDDLGPVYGHQWRYFNAKYENCKTDYKNKGIDQLQEIIDCLKDPKLRNSRRLVLSAWNPCQINEMALPPCHVMMQFNVSEDKFLSCSLYQRSGDVGLGVPFNIASYAFLTHLIAHHCNLIAKEFVYYLGNTHIYDDHIDSLTIQKEKTPFNFPEIKIKNIYNSIDEYLENDFEIINYQFHEPIKMQMRV